MLGGTGHHGIDRLQLGDVRRRCIGLPACGVDFIGHRLGALGKKVVHYYTRTFGCEFDANLPAYALPAASDEGDLSVQSEFHGITFECFV